MAAGRDKGGARPLVVTFGRLRADVLLFASLGLAAPVVIQAPRRARREAAGDLT